MSTQPWHDPEIDEIRSAAQTWAEETFPNGLERDRVGDSYSNEAWKMLADHGFFGLCVPTEFGGEGRPVVRTLAAFEGLAAGCLDSGMVYAAISQVFGIQMPLALLASSDLVSQYMPGIITGDITLAHALTEEGGGSDAFGMATAAEKGDDGWRLTGTKTFITNAPNADMALVFARTGEGRSPFSLSAFFVDMTWHGASYGRTFEKTGLRTVPMGELIFDDVLVPHDHVVGRAGMGLLTLTESTGWERGLLLVHGLGAMGRILELTTEHARSRQAYDKPIGSFQQVSSKVADMVSRHRIARMLMYDIAARIDAGSSASDLLSDTAVAKLYISEAYVDFMRDAVQLHGVRGILYDWQVQQGLRDAIPSTIWGGTSETLRNTIAKLEGLPVD